MKRKMLVVLVGFVMSMLLSGCYWKVAVEESEVGLLLVDGVKISKILHGGRYGPSFEFYSSIAKINTSAQSLEWNDPDLVTSDKQPIGLTIAVTYARKNDDACIQKMWTQFRSEATNDEVLKSAVINRIPRTAKAVTAEFTLDGMLGVSLNSDSNRQVVTNRFAELLSEELDEICVSLLDAGINNIAPSDSYLSLLQRKADAQVAVEVAQKEAAQLVQELEKEQQQTNIEVEQARRKNLVNEELAKTYELNDRYFELEKLRLLAEVMGENDKIYFVPQGTELTLFLTGEGAPVLPPSD